MAKFAQVERPPLSHALECAPAGVMLPITLEPKGGSPTGKATGPIVMGATQLRHRRALARLGPLP